MTTEGAGNKPTEEEGVCRIEGCEEPVFEMFKGKKTGLCSGHAIEALTQFCETEWEGDSLKEISEGEQVGARIREVSGIGTKYQPKQKDD